MLDVGQFFGQFFEEFDRLVERGVNPGGWVGVSTRAHIVLPYHRAMDRAAERAASVKIGTTGRGIGPTRTRRRAVASGWGT